jgi:hypothetical protein
VHLQFTLTCTGATAPRQPGGVGVGRAQGLAGQHPNADHPGSCPPVAYLAPRSQPGIAAGDGRPLQLTMDARGLRAEFLGGPVKAALLAGGARRLTPQLCGGVSASPGFPSRAMRAAPDDLPHGRHSTTWHGSPRSGRPRSGRRTVGVGNTGG